VAIHSFITFLQWLFICVLINYVFYIFLLCFYACTNCGMLSACDPCDCCNNLTACRLYKRRHPRQCFDFADSSVCQACEKKAKKPTTISSTPTVREVDISTNECDISFEAFSSRSSDHIRPTNRRLPTAYEVKLVWLRSYCKITYRSEEKVTI